VRHATRQKTRLGALAAVLFAIGLPAAAAPARAAPKTDVLVLVNGDSVTGEIKILEHGLLTYKTDSMGTLSVEWGEVRSLTSLYFFEITLRSGERLYGSLLPGAGLDTLAIGVAEAARLVLVRDVVHLVPLKNRFWSRFDGSLDIGVSYTKSTQVTQLNLASHTEFKATKDRLALDISTQQSKTGDDPAKVRRSAILGWAHLLAGRWYLGLQTGAERNDELGIAGRLLLTTGAGYYFLEIAGIELNAMAGLTGNTEQSTGSDIFEENLEAVLSASWSFFRYNTPKTNISLLSTGYANLNRGPRYRFEIDLSASREIIKDFALKLTYYEQVDSSPPASAAAFNDYGIVASAVWKY
jgi:hypothetical protein